MGLGIGVLVRVRILLGEWERDLTLCLWRESLGRGLDSLDFLRGRWIFVTMFYIWC